MKFFNFTDIGSNLFAAALVAILTAALSLMIPLLTINGGVYYYISEDKENYLLSLSIYSSLAESSNVEIGFSSPVEAVVASSGTAGIEITNPTGRAGSILSITKIPPRTDYTAIVRGSKTHPLPAPLLISAPTGFILSKGNVFQGRINYWQIAAQAPVVFLLQLIVIQIFKSKISGLNDSLEDNKRKLHRIEGDLSSNRATLYRIKAYTLATIRYLRTENEFWRLNIERLLVSGGASRVMARRLLEEVSKKFGVRPVGHVDDEDIDIVIDIMIDEEKRRRFEKRLNTNNTA